MRGCSDATAVCACITRAQFLPCLAAHSPAVVPCVWALAPLMRTRLRSWVRVIPAGKRAAGRRHRLTGTMMVRFQPLGRQILSWAAEEELFTASGAVAKGKHLPVGILPLPAHTAPPHRRGAATSSTRKCCVLTMRDVGRRRGGRSQILRRRRRSRSRTWFSSSSAAPL